MKLKLKTKPHSGMSLVEVVIVLAISGLLIGIALTTFGQRKNVATKDAVNQMIASLQGVRNEAQKGLGPSTPAIESTINSGETLFGEAVQFSNTCPGSQGCMIVSKLKRSADKSTVTAYESYTIPLKESLKFNWGSGDCTTQYIGCYKNSSAYTPVSSTYPMVVYSNGSGAAYYFDTNTSGLNNGFNNIIQGPRDTQNYTTGNQGDLQLAPGNADPNTTTQYIVNVGLNTPDQVDPAAYNGTNEQNNASNPFKGR